MLITNLKGYVNKKKTDQNSDKTAKSKVIAEKVFFFSSL